MTSHIEWFLGTAGSATTWPDQGIGRFATGITDAAALGAGDGHTCAVSTDGSVSCWGRNTYGQLGDGTTTSSTTAVSVSGVTDATAVDAGGDHTCALLTSSTLKCWGWGYYGQLGNGNGTSSSTPVTAVGL